MAAPIDSVLITQFSNLLHVEAQQTKSRLMGRFQSVPVTGDEWAYDGTGTVEARTANERNPRISPTNPEFSRRRMLRDRILVELIVDNRDVRGMFEDPNSKLVRDCMYAIYRKADKIGIDALFAAVATGRRFDTTVTFAGEGGQTVNATAGLTYAKLLEIRENFRSKEVGTDMPEGIVLGLSEQEETQLFNITQLTSGDFSRNYVVDKGQVVSVLGMDIVCFGSAVDNPQLAVASAVRDCFAASTKGLIYGMSKEFGVKVIPDYPGYVESTYIQVLGEIGAVRTDGDRIQKVQTTAS
jgi:hypothetical protein